LANIHKNKGGLAHPLAAEKRHPRPKRNQQNQKENSPHARAKRARVGQSDQQAHSPTESFCHGLFPKNIRGDGARRES